MPGNDAQQVLRLVTEADGKGIATISASLDALEKTAQRVGGSISGSLKPLEATPNDRGLKQVTTDLGAVDTKARATQTTMAATLKATGGSADTKGLKSIDTALGSTERAATSAHTKLGTPLKALGASADTKGLKSIDTDLGAAGRAASAAHKTLGTVLSVLGGHADTSGVGEIDKSLTAIDTHAGATGGKLKSFLGSVASTAGGVVVADVGTKLAGGLKDAVGASSDFDDALLKTKALAGASTGEMDQYKQGILDLSTQVPVSAKDMADALFMVRSAGFQGADALNILKISGQASAAGMGDMATVASTVTSVMTAYKSSGMTASQAMDTLTAAVTAGKANAADFAPALGNVVAIAGTAGIGFDQVAASMAVMTRENGNADESATALRGTIQNLIKPGKDAQSALASIGLTSADILGDIKDVDKGGLGLQGTLQLISDKAGGDIVTMEHIIPNVRALSGVMSTAGTQGQAYADALDSIQNSGGRTADAFATMQQSASFQMGLLKNNLQKILIEVGDKVLPIFTSGLSFITDHLPDFIGSVENIFGRLGEIVSPVVNGLTQLLGTIAGKVGNIWDWLFGGRQGTDTSGASTTMVSRMQVFMQTFTQQVLPVIETGIGKIGTVVGGIFDFVQTQIIPALGGLADFIITKVAPAIGNFIGGDVLPKIQAFGNVLVNDIIPAVGNFIDALRTDVAPKALDAAQAAIQFLADHKEILGAVALTIGTILVASWVADAVAATTAAVANAAALAPFILGVAIIAGISLAIIELVKHWGDITAAVPQLGVAFDAVKQGLSAFGSWMTGSFFPGVATVFSGIVAAVTAVIGFVRDNWTQIEGLFKGPLDIIVAYVEGEFNLIKDEVQTAIDIVRGIIQVAMDLIHGDWSKAWTDIENMLSNVWDDIKRLIGDQLTALEGELSGAWETVTAAMGLAWDAIKLAAGLAWQGIKDAIITPIKDAITAIGDKASGLLGTIWNAITGVFNDLLTWVLQTWAAVTNDIVTPVKDAITAIGDKSSGILSTIWDAFTGAFSAVTDWMGSTWTAVKDDILTPIKDAATALGDATTGILGGIWTAITGAFHAVWQWFTDHGGDLVTVIESPFKALGTSLPGLVKGAFNDVISVLNTFLSGYEMFIDGIVGAVNWILGKLGLSNWEVPKVSVQIPQLAAGTSNWQGGLAIVGEAGPELVSLPAGSAVLPADQTQQVLKGEQVTDSAGHTRTVVGQPRMGIDIPGFLFGLDPGAVLDKLKSAWDSIQSFAKDWLAKGAESLLDTALNAVGAPLLTGGGALADIGKGIASTVKNDIVDSVKELLGLVQKAQPVATAVAGGPVASDIVTWANAHAGSLGIDARQLATALVAVSAYENGLQTTPEVGGGGGQGPFQLTGPTLAAAESGGTNPTSASSSLDFFLRSGDLRAGIAAYLAAGGGSSGGRAMELAMERPSAEADAARVAAGDWDRAWQLANAIVAGAGAAANPLGAAGTWVKPLGGAYTITQGFGPAAADVAGMEPGGFHEGIDLASFRGDAVLAALAGVVHAAGMGAFGGLGIAVVLDHGQGLETIYGHMLDTVVAQGQLVNAGDLLGHEDSTGASTGDHLHFQVDQDGTAVNPLSFITLASGGTVKKPTAAIVGEAGPEAIVPTPQLDALKSLPGIATSVGQILTSVQQSVTQANHMSMTLDVVNKTLVSLVDPTKQTATDTLAIATVTKQTAPALNKPLSAIWDVETQSYNLLNTSVAPAATLASKWLGTIAGLDTQILGTLTVGPASLELADKWLATIANIATGIQGTLTIGPASLTVANQHLAVLAPLAKLQHGGVVTQPTFALIAEAGPEAVLPLTRMSPAYAGSSPGTAVVAGNEAAQHTSVQSQFIVNDTVLAEMVYSGMDKNIRMRGTFP